MIASIERRFAEILDNVVCSLATFLDPLAKNFPQGMSYCILFVYWLIDWLIVQVVWEMWFKILLCPKSALNHPLSLLCSRQRKTKVGILLFWMKVRNHFLLSNVESDMSTIYLNATVKRESVPEFFVQRQPVALQNLYFAICGIPAATSEVERLFSLCGHINSPRRSSFAPEHL